MALSPHRQIASANLHHRQSIAPCHRMLPASHASSSDCLQHLQTIAQSCHSNLVLKPVGNRPQCIRVVPTFVLTNEFDEREVRNSIDQDTIKCHVECLSFFICESKDHR